MLHRFDRLLPLLTLAGCAHTAHARIDLLEARLSALEAAIGYGQESQRREDDATEQLEHVMDAITAGRIPEARAMVASILSDFNGTSAAQTAEQLGFELAVVGQTAEEISVQSWVQGTATLADAPITLVVFWEVWCPYCRQYLPALAKLQSEWADRGVQLIGLTRLSRGTTLDEVRQFAADHSISFPLGVEDGSLAEAYHVQGIPALAIVRGGEIVWRGHPAQLGAGVMEGLASATPGP